LPANFTRSEKMTTIANHLGVPAVDTVGLTMGRDLILKLRSDSPHINTVGAIYDRSDHDDAPPKVTEVLARSTQASRFVLNPGRYEYRYFVQAGSGKYTLSVSLLGSDAVLQQKDFDSEIATHGLIFRFEIPKPPTSGGKTQ
jgi:hypothetical protein